MSERKATLLPRGPKPSCPHTLFLSVRDSWMDCLHFLLLFPVLSWRAPRTNCIHSWFPFRRSSWMSCLHFLFFSLRGARTHPLCLLCLGGSATDLHGLAEGPSGFRTMPLSSTVGSPGPAAGRQINGLCAAHLGSSGLRTAPLSSTVGSPGPAAGRQISGLCTAHLGSSGLRTAPLSSTVGSPGPAASRQIIGFCVAGLQTTYSYVTGLLIACSYDRLLIAGSAGDVCLNAGSARDSFRAVCLNSGSAMNNKDSSYLQTSSFRTSSPHIGPLKNLIMTTSFSGC
ncbi:hypothetical protein CRENBAI_023721 [Crenichthys baileyi]|uniref:Uncharacterized protein n=1 Tax=Crenichthys baileyi TaxID=28760 RepID=A0AAV9SRN4_9TELE